MVERRLPQRPQLDAASAVGGRIVILRACRERGDLLLRLCATDAGFEENVGFDPTRTSVLKPVSCAVETLFHRCGYPELNSATDERTVEALRRDANNGVRDIL